MVYGWRAQAAAAAGQIDEVSPIKSFNDPSLSNGHFLLSLLAAVRPVVDWSLVSDGADHDAKVANARLVISVARKLGASVFCVPEAIADGEAKMIMSASRARAPCRGRGRGVRCRC